MANIGIDALKDKIDEKIVTNGAQEITAAVLNDVLQDSVDTLADGGNLDDGSVTKGKLAQNVSTDLDWAVASNSYYRNSQAGNVAAKEITTYKNMSLIGGGSLKVTFEQANTADDATLNIDGKGAKPLYYNGARVSSTNSWEANETVEIYYNNYNSGAYYAKRWMVEPVSVSQNTETGKTELLIGDTPALIVDNEPEAGSDNLVTSGGVWETKLEADAAFNKIGGTRVVPVPTTAGSGISNNVFYPLKIKAGTVQIGAFNVGGAIASGVTSLAFYPYVNGVRQSSITISVDRVSDETFASDVDGFSIYATSSEIAATGHFDVKVITKTAIDETIEYNAALASRKVEKLVWIGPDSSGYSDWTIGDRMFNTITKRIKRCTRVSPSLAFEDYNVSTESIYIYQNNLYYYDASTQSLKADNEILSASVSAINTILNNKKSVPIANSTDLITSGGVEATLFHQMFSKEIPATSTSQTIALREFNYGKNVAIRIVSNTSVGVTINAEMRDNGGSSTYHNLSSDWTLFELSDSYYDRVYICTKGAVTTAGTITCELIFGDAFESVIKDSLPVKDSAHSITSAAVYDVVEKEKSENSKIWNEITDINGSMQIEYYQGHVKRSNGQEMATSTRVSNMPFYYTGRVRISCSGDINIGYIYRYKNTSCFEEGGTSGVDFISYPISSSEERGGTIIESNIDFPYFVVVLWNKNDQSSDLTIDDVKSSGTQIYGIDDKVRHIERVLDGINEVIDLGTISYTGLNSKQVLFDSPIILDDYCKVTIETERIDEYNNEVLMYVLYSTASSDKQRLLPNICPNGKTISTIPHDISDKSYNKKEIIGLLIYNAYNIDYSFNVKITLYGKFNGYKRYNIPELDANLIPAYYKANDYLWKKMKVINAYLRANILSGDAFYFVTDTHWEWNQRHSPALIKELNKKLNIQRILHGGDIYHQGETQDFYEVDCINSFRDAIGSDRVYCCRGNHEYVGNDTYGDVFTETSMYLHNAVFGGPDKQYFYIDNNIQKIRYIFLWSFGIRVGGEYTYGFKDTDQMDWFENVALSVDAGWDIFIVTHYTTSPSRTQDSYDSIPGYSNFENIVNSYNGEGRIVAILNGHTHRDYIVLGKTTAPIVITTCDHNANFTSFGTRDFDNLQTPRISGTIEEQAFDAVVYDRTNVLLHCIRIGSCADNKLNMIQTNEQVDCRSVYCTPKSVNDSVALPTYLTGTVSWESSDTSIATVNNGTAFCVSTGNVRITATDENGEKQSFYITIE